MQSHLLKAISERQEELECLGKKHIVQRLLVGLLIGSK